MVWREANIVEKAEALRELNALERHYRFRPEETFIDLLSLPFYPGGTLLRVRKTGNPLWYVKLGSEVVVLDGSGANINYLDVKAPLALAEKGSPAYRRFREAFGSNHVPEDFTL